MGTYSKWSVFQVICSVVGHYVDKVSEHLPDSVGELEQVPMHTRNMYVHAVSYGILALLKEKGL